MTELRGQDHPLSLIWVRAGQCNHETTIEARRVDLTHVSVESVTTWEHIQRLSAVLVKLDIAHEMSTNLLDTEVYRTADEFVCRNSCVVPAAILKALEVEANLFPASRESLRLRRFEQPHSLEGTKAWTCKPAQSLSQERSRQIPGRPLRPWEGSCIRPQTAGSSWRPSMRSMET